MGQAVIPVHSQVGAIPVVIDPHVPLSRPERFDVSKNPIPLTDVPVLFWIIFGQIHVHPDRVEEFRLHVTSSAAFPYEKAKPGT